jgi:hypothetical protein
MNNKEIAFEFENIEGNAYWLQEMCTNKVRMEGQMVTSIFMVNAISFFQCCVERI